MADNNVSHIRGAYGAMRRLTEKDIDAQIASNRERFHDSIDHFGEQRRRRPLLIPLDSSLLARAIRALRWAFHLKGPKP